MQARRADVSIDEIEQTGHRTANHFDAFAAQLAPAAQILARQVTALADGVILSSDGHPSVCRSRRPRPAPGAERERAMEHLQFQDFRRRMAGGLPCGHHPFSLCYGLKFHCACGGDHEFMPSFEIVCGLPRLRFVVACPEGGHWTGLKMRWSPSRSSLTLESEIGTVLPRPRRRPLN